MRETGECLIFIGPPTSGKTSHTSSFSRRLGVSTFKGSEVALSLTSQYEPQRLMIPDDIFVPRLRAALAVLTPPFQVFDNVPRTGLQAEMVEKWSKAFFWSLNTLVLELPLEEALARSAVREVCSACQEPYHPQVKPALQVGQCDLCHSPLERRAGDNPDKVVLSYERYIREREQILPVLSQSSRVYLVDAMGMVNSVASQIEERLARVGIALPGVRV